MTDLQNPAPTSALTAALRRAFRSAHYRFDTPRGPLLLQIGHYSEPLRQLLHETGHACAAAITAYNPGGQPRDNDRNQGAQQQLERELLSMGLTCFPGRHEDPQGQWPVEFSALVLGLSCSMACRIAARYGQLAVVWSDAAGTPQLIEAAAHTLPAR